MTCSGHRDAIGTQTLCIPAPTCQPYRDPAAEPIGPPPVPMDLYSLGSVRCSAGRWGRDRGGLGRAPGAGRVRGQVWGHGVCRQLGCPVGRGWGVPGVPPPSPSAAHPRRALQGLAWTLAGTCTPQQTLAHAPVTPWPPPAWLPAAVAACPRQHQQPTAHHSPLPWSPSHRTDRATCIYKGEGLGGAGGSPPRVHMMSSRRLGLATQSRVRGSEAAMIMHMNCLPVLLSMG